MFKSVTLEMSLKPFKRTDAAYIESVCEQVFRDWRVLVEPAEEIKILFWTADGSEILDYRGKLSDQFEWAYLIGGANDTGFSNPDVDPEGLCLHKRHYLYMDNPPVMTYAILKNIVACVKKVGARLYPKSKILVGATFDPGPEFAKSDFKYNRHREICLGSDMGKATMVCAYAKLKGDSVSYAGFPEGIPDGLPLGTFFGRQAEVFLTDMGFDYLWLSNGFGFGRETWNTTGAIFDGEKFHYENLPQVLKEVMEFWTLFRKECHFPVETRGTNMSCGIDYASDGVPLEKIYNGGFQMLPPPNSPWAALNFDFGLELMGYMSRIAEIPDKRFLFRYYIHDPWWLNTPWYDRYNRQPHDIYLPMAICRIDEAGKPQTPTDFNILTIDNSYGDMPQNCVIEPLPHLMAAQKDAPDEIPPFVWVYPFSEYNNAESDRQVNNMFFEDWFIRGAINHSLPLSAVVSTDNFVKQNKEIYQHSVLITPVPKADSVFETEILEYIKQGGKVLFYGAADGAGEAFCSFFRIKPAKKSLEGDLTLCYGENTYTIQHNPILSSGGICMEQADSTEVLATVENNVYAAANKNACWLRGTSSNVYKKGVQLLQPLNPEEYFIAETLMVDLLKRFGYSIQFKKRKADSKQPVIMLSKNNSALFFSVFSADTTVTTGLRFPLGIPVLDGFETYVEDGHGFYTFPKSVHAECRVFVEQQGGVVGCREQAPVSYQHRRKIVVTGLENAEVRFLPETYAMDKPIAAILEQNGKEKLLPADSGVWKEDENGKYVLFSGITGTLTLMMPNK